MSEHDSFEDRVRALADQISRSMQRMADVDLEQLAEGYGVDVDRARTAASAAGQWLSDRLSTGEPLFDEDRPHDHGTAAPGPSANLEEQVATPPSPAIAPLTPGIIPWTLRPVDKVWR